MITRRCATIAIAGAILTHFLPRAHGQPKPVHGVDENGNRYTDYFRGWRSTNQGFAPWIERVYDKPAKKLNGSDSPGGLGAGIRPPATRMPVTREQDERNYEAAKAQVKANDPDVIVDERASASSYSFGSAGTQELVTGFAYGVAAMVAGLPDQAQRINSLQSEVIALQNSLAQQLVTQTDASKTVAAELAERGAQLDKLLGNDASWQALLTVDAALAANQKSNLYATPDPIFAANLHQLSLAFGSEEAQSKPAAAVNFGRALARQADAESALGNDDTSTDMYGLARVVADAVVGIDPFSGVIRSSYELVTGINLITQQPLSGAERGFAAVNLVLIGGFSSATKGLQALGRVARVIGGMRGKAIVETVVSVLKNWPVRVVDRIIDARASGFAKVGEEVIALAKTRDIIPVGAVDGVYARVMRREAAEGLLNGGKLSKESIAFITEANQLSSMTSGSDIARRLGLVQLDFPYKFAELSDHVIVEFKFASKEPLAFLAKPFGEAGAFGPAFLPGGYTSGGAVEWVIDSEAISKGLIDASSITTRPIIWP